MEGLLVFCVAVLAFANGANDNFKGVATLWGAGRTSYPRALAWGTGFTFLGSLAAGWLATELAAKFNGSTLVATESYTQPAFLVAVSLGAGTTVLLAARLGLPISTTHALTGALLGAGVTAAGAANMNLAPLGAGVVLPLLFSPLIAVGLTWAGYWLVQRCTGTGAARDCLCVDEKILATAPTAGSMAVAVTAPPAVRWASSAECYTGVEVIRLRLADALHWLSGAAISFARGLNDTPKIVALLLVLGAAGATQMNYALVAMAMAAGGALGASRVARTMSKQITPMSTGEAVTANLVAASLVTLASVCALPVSTTHVTSGGVFGIGLLRRREADWRRVREILLSWGGTLPLGTLLAAITYWLLAR